MSLRITRRELIAGIAGALPLAGATRPSGLLIDTHIHLFAADHTSKAEPGGQIRLDDWEMRDDVQSAVAELWHTVSTDNLNQVADFRGYQSAFLELFGFGLAGIDYSADVDHMLQLGS